MFLRRSRWHLTGLFAICLLVLGCGNEDNNLGSRQSVGAIPEGTTETLVYVSVDDFEVPIYLSIPAGCENAPLPAVVVMHGSGGMWSNDDPSTETMSGQFREWQALLAQNCIVGAFVDSYTGRGILTKTGKWEELPDNFRISSQFVRPRDANAALSMLQNLTFDDGSYVVEIDKIAILGFSDGASAVAATLIDTDRISDDFEWTQSQNGKEYDASDGVLSPQRKPEIGFSGGVFYYGGSVGHNYWGRHPCSSEAMEENIFFPYAPILYNIPEEDSLTDNTLCMVDLLMDKGAPIELILYSGVGHGFDYDDVSHSTTARNNTIKWLQDLWFEN
ncbi:dienelactone hydrolase family protein [Flagellimonas sp. 2504JD4-2]